MQYTGKWSNHFELLTSFMNISFDPLPASCLQQFNAWKEQVVRYQELSGKQLPDSIKLSSVKQERTHTQGKAKSQTPASSNSLEKEAKDK